MAKVLIVDDEKPIRNLLKAILERSGHECTCAADAAQARKILQQKGPFDLLLSDLQMPGEPGLDFVKFVLKAYPDMATLIVTVMDSPEIAVAALASGVYGYIVKPFEPRAILFDVANALHRRELEMENRRYRQRLETLVEGRTQQLLETIKDLHRIQKELREAEAKYRTLFETSPDIVYITSRDGRILEFNPAAVEFFGYTEEELQDLNVLELYDDPSERDRFRKLIEEQGFVKDYELRLKKRSGETVHCLVTASLFEDKDGRILGYQGIIKDITERKRMEQELRRLSEEKEYLLDRIPSVLILIDPEGCVQFWNRKAAEVLGLSSSQVLGKEIVQCPVSWDWERMQPALMECEEGERVIKIEELRFERPDGTMGILGVTLNPFPWKGGRGKGILLSASDVTERKKLEAQLAQAHKLEAIGQLARGIAHEINTPTQYVGDNTRFLQEAFEDLCNLLERYRDLKEKARLCPTHQEVLCAVEEAEQHVDLPYLLEEIPKALEQTLEGIERISHIVRSIKEFSHPGKGEKMPLDINHALENTATVARNEWKYVADLELDLDPHLPPVPCYAAEINQAFLNILVNAAHAVAEVVGDGTNGKGKITISTSHKDGYVEVRIKDTGPGIPEEIQSRIFDPFFTTKEVGKGTGQGLAIAHSIVREKHGGEITFETELGKGTTFIVRLPLASEGAADQR